MYVVSILKDKKFDEVQLINLSIINQPIINRLTMIDRNLTIKGQSIKI